MANLSKRLDDLERARAAGKTVILVHREGDDFCTLPGRPPERIPLADVETRFAGMEITWLRVVYEDKWPPSGRPSAL